MCFCVYGIQIFVPLPVLCLAKFSEISNVVKFKVRFKPLDDPVLFKAGCLERTGTFHAHANAFLRIW